MIAGAAFTAFAVCMVLPPVLDQQQTVLAFTVFFMTAWMIMTAAKEFYDDLQDRRDLHRIRKGKRREKTVDINLSRRKKNLWIEETPTGKYARWL